MTTPVPGVHFTFYYETPQPNDPSGNPVPNAPTSFTLGGVSLNVAKAIRAGLINRAAQAGITNVSTTRHQDASDTITDAST